MPLFSLFTNRPDHSCLMTNGGGVKRAERRPPFPAGAALGLDADLDAAGDVFGMAEQTRHPFHFMSEYCQFS